MTSLFLLFFGALISPQALSHKVPTSDAWTVFKTTYGRLYSTVEEELYRAQVFSDNLKVIQQHNAEFDAGRSTYRLGVNQFADATNAEFRRMLLANRHKLHHHSNATAGSKTARTSASRPASFDWREQGVPITIKDQGQLGDAVSIATVSALEDGLFISSGRSVALSTQNLRDCVDMPSVVTQLEYVRDHGIADEVTYPQHTGIGPCRQTETSATVKEVITVKDGDEDALAENLLKNPAAVEIDAGNISFQLYSSGIYSDPKCSSSRIDHAVLLVGYGATQEVEFWTLANSWGSAWGEQGFMRMKRGVNMCGVASYAAVPTEVQFT